MNIESKLSNVEKRLKDMEFALNETMIVSISDEHDRIQFVNDNFCAITKYGKEELIGKGHRELNSGVHSPAFFKELWETIRVGKVWRGVVCNKAKDGSLYWADTAIVPFMGENGKPYQYIDIKNDITERVLYEKTIKELAFQDALTKIPNRNYLSVWFKEDMKELTGTYTAFFIDVDNFKFINDNFGHYYGDVTLKETANRIKEVFDAHDFICRFGGDEFIAISNCFGNQEELVSIVKALQESLSQPFFINGNQIFPTTSIGVASETLVQADESQHFFEELILHADFAMYKAKKISRNQYCFHTESHTKEMKRNQIMIQTLTHALDFEQFRLMYQPLIDMKTNEVVAAEVLLRWQHPELGFVSPVEFIPLLENHNFIIPIGKMVIEAVCKQMKQWEKDGFHLNRVCINMSPVQFNDVCLIQDLKDIIAEQAIDPSFIEFEITESSLFDFNRSLHQLNELRDIGFRTAIDDFGTGYSSLQYLRDLPVHTLKIDKSFIQTMSASDDFIVKSVTVLGNHLSLDIVAEGVETTHQYEQLQAFNCTIGQGYLWSEPLSADAFVTWVHAFSIKELVGAGVALT